jgi:hypothetical protein
MKACPHCGQPIEDPSPDKVAAAEEPLAAEKSRTASPQGAEFDHRGVRLPARTRVGGIIIPQ